MTVDRLLEIIYSAQEVHKTLRNQVDFASQDKKHAIYILQGGALTCVSSALAFHQRGYFLPRAQQKRMIDEIIDLIAFFDEISDESRYLRAWFSGHVVSREPGNKGNLDTEDRAKMYFLTREQIQTLDSLRKKMADELSKYMHPTIQAMRANMSKNLNVFDYHHLNTNTSAQKSMSYEDFGNLYIVPTLHSLLIPVRTLHLTEKQFDEMRAFDKELQTAGSGTKG